jgi:hypothetical protein
MTLITWYTFFLHSGVFASSQSQLTSLLWGQLLQLRSPSTTSLGIRSPTTLYPISRRLPSLRPRSTRRRLLFFQQTGLKRDIHLPASPSRQSDYARSQQCCSIIQTRQTDYRRNKLCRSARIRDQPGSLARKLSSRQRWAAAEREQLPTARVQEGVRGCKLEPFAQLFDASARCAWIRTYASEE